MCESDGEMQALRKLAQAPGLEITDHQLVVKGEISKTAEEKEKSFILHERLEKTFERRFYLPEQADPKKVVAKFDRGVLEIHAPKVAPAAPRRIAIGKG